MRKITLALGAMAMLAAFWLVFLTARATTTLRTS